MKSAAVIKRSVNIAGHNTSISLEDEFWDGLQEIAESRGKPASHLIASINAERKSTNLSSAVRLFVLGFYRDQDRSRKLVDVALLEAPTLDSLDPPHQPCRDKTLGPLIKGRR
jgi:predicted DNA-binding ribbon-helix-helix protein